ncbi:MAG: flagellar basal body-associated FliL family protein [Candidatus Acidiferrales bacterium]
MTDDPILEARLQKKSGSGTGARLMGIVMIAALGLAGWFWHRSASAQATEAAGSASEVQTVLKLDSFVVNLSGASGNGYLRVGMDLGLGIELKEGESRTADVARARDTILGVLGSRTVEELLSPEGKAKLKSDLLNAIRERVPEIRCRDVYFTEFLVQH